MAAHQLNLPGLHYDEAREAGLNAMQLVTWQPLTAFRDATVQIGPWRLPLMVQDYIGALNVLLAMPFLAIGGINTVALRWLSLLIGALTLCCTWRVAKRLGGPVAATATALLLAVDPSFIFWNRQGIFVTNLTALLFLASLLTGLRWWTDRRPRDLWLTAFFWGLGIYAKLLFVWAIAAMVGVAAIAWAVGRWRISSHRSEDQRASASKPQIANRKQVCPKRVGRPLRRLLSEPFDRLRARSGACYAHFATRSTHRKRAHRLTATAPPALALALASAAFLVPLIPLVLFNLRTGGTLASIFGNLGQSYYGVDNSAYLSNLAIRLRQLVTLLRGDHFWYLGGIYANAWVPWMAGGLLLAATLIGLYGTVAALGSEGTEQQNTSRFAFLLPVSLLALMVVQSAFTVSDLFITHYALLLPLIPLAGGLAFGTIWTEARRMLAIENESLTVTSHEMGRGRTRMNADEGERAKGDVRVFSRLSASYLGAVALALVIGLALMIWAGGDLWTTIRYHRVLTASGGHASHSDAIYDLAGYLNRGGLSAPVALDWGMDAQIRFLTASRVKPIEVFGYAGLAAPDPEFADRIANFLDNPDNVYIAHAPDQAVFRDRVETLSTLAKSRGMTLQEETRFSERNGTPLFVVYRVAR